MDETALRRDAVAEAGDFALPGLDINNFVTVVSAVRVDVVSALPSSPSSERMLERVEGTVAAVGPFGVCPELLPTGA